jgi:hypothetical protein
MFRIYFLVALVLLLLLVSSIVDGFIIFSESKYNFFVDVSTGILGAVMCNSSSSFSSSSSLTRSEALEQISNRYFPTVANQRYNYISRNLKRVETFVPFSQNNNSSSIKSVLLTSFVLAPNRTCNVSFSSSSSTTRVTLFQVVSPTPLSAIPDSSSFCVNDSVIEQLFSDPNECFHFFERTENVTIEKFNFDDESPTSTSSTMPPTLSNTTSSTTAATTMLSPSNSTTTTNISTTTMTSTELIPFSTTTTSSLPELKSQLSAIDDSFRQV